MTHRLMNRREFTATLLGGTAVAAGLTPGRSAAQNGAEDGWPSRTIRVIVPYPAGGIVDVITRAATERMSASLPQRVIVESKPGADGRIGMETCATSPADGYTLLAATPVVAVNEFLHPDSTMKMADFTAIGGIATTPAVFVVANSLPVHSMKELVAYAKARPGQLNVGNPGVGSSLHLAQELLFETTGMAVQNIGYKGQPPAIIDLVQGTIGFALISESLILPHVKAGRVRALAVNAAQRTRMLPEVPTIGEAGYPQALTLSWYGLAAPAKTPAAIIAKLAGELQRALQLPETRTALDGIDAPVLALDAAGFGKLMHDENVRWGKLIRERNIKA